MEEKNLTGETKNGENVPSLQVVEVVLVQKISINKSLKYYAPLHPKNLMLICYRSEWQTIRNRKQVLFDVIY